MFIVVYKELLKVVPSFHFHFHFTKDLFIVLIHFEQTLFALLLFLKVFKLNFSQKIFKFVFLK